MIARVEAILRRSEIERERGGKEAEQQAKVELEEFKQKVIRNVRHELRTPLVNVILPLELAISEKFEEPEEQSAFIHTALANVDKLHSLVEDFILLSDIENNNLNTIRQEIDFKSILATSIQRRLEFYKDKNFNPRFENHGQWTVLWPAQ